MIRRNNEDAAQIELWAVRRRFLAFVAEGGLVQEEVAAFLGVATAELGPDLMPRTLGRVAEHRMRLLVEIHRLLSSALAQANDMSVLLREPSLHGGLGGEALVRDMLDCGSWRFSPGERLPV
jgi:hypothetical protein